VAKSLPPKKAAPKPVAKKTAPKKAAPKKIAAKKPTGKPAAKTTGKVVIKKAAPQKAPVKKIEIKKPAVIGKTHALQVASNNPTPVKSAPKADGKAAGKKESNIKNLQELMRDKVLQVLDDGKAEDTMCIDVRGQSPICDFLVITTGRSSRAVNALSHAVEKGLLECGAKGVRNEGKAAGDWAVVDGGDVIVHVFRPEVRAFYRLEEVWGLEPPLHEAFRDL
jgi:ribosome-associated protein